MMRDDDHDAPRQPWLRPRTGLGLALASALAACSASSPPPSPALPPPADPRALRAPAAFAVIEDEDDRSVALFTEASRVLLHPRCVNCHPDGDSPLQGDEGRIHDPPVLRGPDDHGVAGLECGSCHQDTNLELARVPGAPLWHLAPRSMTWQNRTPGQICEQLKDPARNGGKTLAQIVEHSAHDKLVAWGWSPGHGREPAPGTQEQFGALMAAWSETGAACPPASPAPATASASASASASEGAAP